MSVSAVSSSKLSTSSASGAMLQKGSSGPQVLKLQKALLAAGFNPKGLDGKFGPATEAALKAFQKAAKIVVDGKAGAQTWNALNAWNAKKAAPAPAPAASNPAAPPTLRQGSSGDHVRWMQALLKNHGFNPGGVDGKFGPMTHKAVVAFQLKRGLNGSGVVGPNTWGLLSKVPGTSAPAPAPAPAPAAPAATPAPAAAPPSLKQGASGDHVRWMQALLKNHGFGSGGVDGNFGPKTHSAVVAFQKKHGLAGSGLVGPKTWALLSKTPTAPPAAPTTPTGPTGTTRPGISGMLDWAKSMIGSKYAAVNPFRFGEVLWDGKPHVSVNGSGSTYNYPKGTRVFDCSGFIVTAFKKLGVNLLGKGLATSWAFHDNKSGFLQPVARNNLQPGDLITYIPSKGVGHVVIYLGNGKTIEAAGGVGVTIRDVNWARFQSGRRVPLP